MQSFRRSAVCLTAINKQITRYMSLKNATVTVNNEQSQLKSWRDIPGPSSLPVIGQLHHFLPGGSLSKITTDLGDILYESYGPIIKLDGYFGSPSIVVLVDAEASAQVLRGENWLPHRPGFMSLEYFRKEHNKIRDPNEPTGLVTDHGDTWKKFRSTVNPIMLHTKTIRLYSNILNEVADDMIKRMRLLRNDKNIIEGKFDVEMNLWALESIGVVALGGRLNCLDQNLPEDSPARKLIQTVHDIFKSADELDFKPSLWRYISTPTFKKAMKHYQDQITLSKHFIEKAIEQLNLNVKHSDEEKGILQKLLDIDKDIAVIMAIDMLMAGVDTAANTIISTLYLLALNPEKQIKLREEIRSQDEKRPYLKATLKESMRLLPVVPGNMRLTSKEYHILGYRIPEKTYVTFFHQTLGKMEQHFPRSKEFIPERWIVEKTDPLYYGNAHPFAFNPFGFGVRSCIGRRIAELEMETFLAKLIDNFHVEWFGPPIKVQPKSLNYNCEPFNFIFKDVS